MTKQTITEEMGIHKGWYEEADKMTLDKLPKFLQRLTTQYEHDYGTICHAIAASALAAAHAVDHSPEGGITGFQASGIMWEFIQHWTRKENEPMRLLMYSEMLYPQYENKFNAITQDTADWLKKEAEKKLLEAHPVVKKEVTAYWELLASGNLPFGVRIEDE